MATYFVASGGSATAPYDTWAKAATSLQTALTAASGGADTVVVQYNAVPSGDAELAADVDYTTAAKVRIVSASNDGGSAYTPTPMGTANWIGNSTTNRRVGFTLGADHVVMMSGLTLRTSGSATADDIRLNIANGASLEMEDCYLWHGNSNASSAIIIGGNSAAETVRLTNTTLRFSNAAHTINIGCTVDLVGCTVSSAGTAPSVLVSSTYGAISHARFLGCDLSFVTGTLVGNVGHAVDIYFDRCKLGSGVVVLATQTSNPTRASARVFVSDCHSGDTHIFSGYYDALGSAITDTGIYYTSGDAAQSLKIVTTANASYNMPFQAQWIDAYNTATASITPYIEILRDLSATAYKDDEVWAEFVAKTTANVTLGTLYADRCTLATKLTGSPANQAAGAGTGSWTGENATAWSGKCDSGAAFTPTEVGYISGRICVGAPSITVYVDPTLRGI